MTTGGPQVVNCMVWVIVLTDLEVALDYSLSPTNVSS